jgi:hypothetical protein
MPLSRVKSLRGLGPTKLGAGHMVVIADGRQQTRGLDASIALRQAAVIFVSSTVGQTFGKNRTIGNLEFPFLNLMRRGTA